MLHLGEGLAPEETALSIHSAVPLLFNTSQQQLPLQKLPPAHSVTQHRGGGGCLPCSYAHFGMGFSGNSSSHQSCSCVWFLQEAGTTESFSNTPELILAEALATHGPQCKRTRSSGLSFVFK